MHVSVVFTRELEFIHVMDMRHKTILISKLISNSSKQNKFTRLVPSNRRKQNRVHENRHNMQS